MTGIAYSSTREAHRIYEARYRDRLRNDRERMDSRNAKERARRAGNPEKWKAYYKGDYDNRRRRNPAAVAMRSARRRAQKYGLLFDLTYEWAKEQYAKGSALSGLPFRAEKGPFSPSVDRVDASKGYTRDNCRMLLNAENLFRNCWTDEVVVEIAQAIVGNVKR